MLSKYRKHWKSRKEGFWAVGNGILWLTPCKRMKLRRSEWAQLGDCTKEDMSLVEGRLWSKLWSYYNRPSPTLTTLFGSVSKLRSQASLHGVNHNMPFPTALKPLFFDFFRTIHTTSHNARKKKHPTLISLIKAKKIAAHGLFSLLKISKIGRKVVNLRDIVRTCMRARVKGLHRAKKCLANIL